MEDFFWWCLKYAYRVIVLYPIGLFRLLFNEQRHKSGRAAIRENSFHYITDKGHACLRSITAAGGMVVLIGLSILMIVVTSWSIFNTITH
jgi:hypothetical protein